MQTQLKTDALYKNHELYVHHDAHIKTYEAQNLGIKVIICDSKGVPLLDSVAPMVSYLPSTSYNM